MPRLVNQRCRKLTISFGLETRPKLAVFDLRLCPYPYVRAEDRVLDFGTAHTALAKSLLYSQRAHFSSTVTKSQMTHPINLAPFPMTQCRPTTHFLMLAFSPTRVPSPIKLSGLICAKGEMGPASSVCDRGVGGALPVPDGASDRMMRLLSSQYPANEFARIRWSGSTGAALDLSFDPFVCGSGSDEGAGAVTTIWHLYPDEMGLMAYSSRGSGVLAVGDGRDELGRGARPLEGDSRDCAVDEVVRVVDLAIALASGSRRGGSRTVVDDQLSAFDDW